MKRKDLFVLIIIFLVGAFFRFYQLGAIPSSLNWDEVSWGYNAYSIGTTGSDEYGKFLPLSFQAFGDYKQPVYVYLDVLPMLIWGLSAFAVRFPSALFGSLTIISVYVLVRELFFKEKHASALALLVAALFALSPWSIQFSRVAFEANVGIFFLISGVACFLYGLRTKRLSLLITGIIILSISCYTYHSQKVFTPLLFLGLLVTARDYLLQKKARLLLLLVVFVGVNSLWLIDARTTARGRSVMFTSQQTQILAEPTKELIQDREEGSIIGQILHNRRLVYANKYLENYLKHFDPNYLFITGDNPRHHAPGMGVLYLVSLPFILFGLVILVKYYPSISLFVLYWFLLAPVASALAVDAPNASRSMVFLPIWQILAGIGIWQFYEIMRRSIKPFIIVLFIGTIYLLNVGYYAHWYVAHTDTEYALDWQYGYKEAVLVANQKTSQQQHIFYTNLLEQPYIFYLFHAHIPPQKYQATGGSSRIKQPCFSIDNAYFGKCEEKERTGDIIISTPMEKRNPALVKTAEILYPNHEPALYIYHYK